MLLRRFEFNTPFGKDRRSYNPSIENNLVQFVKALKEKNIIYNDGKRGFGDWHQKEDVDLRTFLDRLSDKGVAFALSNVFYHKGNTNEELIKWSEKYHVIYLDKKYSNCSYHFKDKNAKTVEVLVTNYE